MGRAVQTSADEICNDLLNLGSCDKELLIVCVGTDRSTGDSYGPLVGTELKRRGISVDVIGDLNEPVHAVNVPSIVERINEEFSDRFVIAVDACLGKLERVGRIIVDDCPLRPGAGVKKELPEFGDITISAVVNIYGFMEHYVLQNTRLSLVMDLAQTTVDAIERFVAGRDAFRLAAATEAPKKRRSRQPAEHAVLVG